ncbi:MAG: FecR family protein, partial [Vicinamibacteria bacterium]
MARRSWIVGLLAAACSASWALGAEDLPPARVRVTEPTVTLQGASDAAAEEAVPNLPFLPGDRVWTDANGRVEFHFADGSRVRLDRRSKLDYQSVDGDETVVLRLWSGSLQVQQGRRGRPARFAVETPNGTADLRAGGSYRLDVTGAETRVSVYEGEATLDAGEQVRLRAGERAVARRGARPWGPDGFDRAEDDAFARWNADLGEDEAWADGGPEDLPEEVSAYADDFAQNGSWFFEAGVGNVWRPRVSIGWQPYVHGRWAWTAYGWTWVPNEPWGWAPYHYGRWCRVGSSWGWAPGPVVARPVYSPALVAFFGGGGVNVSV